MPNLLETLSPAQALTKLYEMDKRSARFLAGGVGVFAAAAVVAAYGIDLATMALIGLYVVGMGLLLIVCAQLPPILRHTLGTCLVLSIVSTVMLFFVSVVSDWPKPAYCLAKFLLPCTVAAEQTAEANPKKVDLPQVIALPSPAPIPAEPAKADLPPAPVVGEQPVYIQFAGLITRDSVRQLNAALRRGGWNVQSSSGERVEAAIGVNEVRYCDPGALPAATALADAVSATAIGSRRIEVRMMPKVGGNLELWISN